MLQHDRFSIRRFGAVFALAAAAFVTVAGAPQAEPQKPASSENGKYLDKDGNPTYNVSDDGKKFDWYTYSGYRRYHAECHVCHGPDGAGSSYAPALAESLKHLSYEQFTGTVIGGKQEVNNTSNQVMPAFGTNKNVVCYLDDLYVYLKARADGALGRTRPEDKEAKSPAYTEAEKACLSG